MGKLVEVEIYETGKHFLKGRLVNNSEVISPGLRNPLTKGKISGLLKNVTILLYLTYGFTE